MSGPNIATRCSGLLSKQTLACCVLVHHVAGCVHLGCVVTVGETLFCLNHDLAHLLYEVDAMVEVFDTCMAKAVGNYCPEEKYVIVASSSHPQNWLYFQN